MEMLSLADVELASRLADYKENLKKKKVLETKLLNLPENFIRIFISMYLLTNILKSKFTVLPNMKEAMPFYKSFGIYLVMILL